MEKVVVIRDPPPERSNSSEKGNSSSENVGSESNQLQNLGICGTPCPLRDIFNDQGPIIQSQRADESPVSDGRMLELAKEIYTAIKPWQTRILTIHAGSFAEPIKCNLEVVDLIAQKGVGVPASSKIIMYEALSYSWGNLDSRSTISCNGIDYPIMQHLSNALRHFRKEHNDRYCWIDALCINQYNEPEKSQQVQNMYLIFEKAAAVLTWLGLPERNDLNALKALQMLSTIPESRKDEGAHETQCYRRLKSLRKATEKIICKTWFTRTWVRQEVFASNRLVIFCGNFNMPFEHFRRAVKLLDTANSEQTYNQWEYPNALVEQIEIIPTSFQRFYALTSKYQRKYRRKIETSTYMNGRDPSLLCPELRTLLEGAAFDVSDSRDMVYGVIGMLRSEYQERYLNMKTLEFGEGRLDPRAYQDAVDYVDEVASRDFLVSYKKQEWEVYQDAFKFLIDQSKDLSVLTIFQNRTSVASGWPSWVINLQQKIYRFIMVPKHPEIPEKGYSVRKWGNYGPPTLKWRQPPIQKWSKTGELQLMGVRLARPLEHEQVSSKIISRLHHLVVPFTDLRYSRDKPITKMLQACSYVHVELGQLGNAKPTARQKRYSAVVPNVAKDGDFIAHLEGGDFPFLLRPDPSATGRYIFLGPVLIVSRYREGYLICGWSRILVCFEATQTTREEFTLV